MECQGFPPIGAVSYISSSREITYTALFTIRLEKRAHFADLKALNSTYEIEIRYELFSHLVTFARKFHVVSIPVGAELPCIL